MGNRGMKGLHRLLLLQVIVKGVLVIMTLLLVQNALIVLWMKSLSDMLIAVFVSQGLDWIMSSVAVVVVVVALLSMEEMRMVTGWGDQA